MDAVAQGGLGPVPNDLFQWWQVLIILAILMTLFVVVAVAVFGYGYWAVKRHPPTSQYVRADMLLVTIGSAVIGWIVAVAIAVDPNSGPAFWRWIWPVVIAGAGVLMWLLWRQRRTPSG
jgi:hypothetical protein